MLISDLVNKILLSYPTLLFPDVWTIVFIADASHMLYAEQSVSIHHFIEYITVIPLLTSDPAN